MNYQHKQPGFVTISVFVIAFLFLLDLLTLCIVFWYDRTPAFVIPLLVALALLMIVLGVLFSSMSIKINNGQLTWHFALGFWKNSFDLSAISSVLSVQNRWWHGWGIRRIPKGWLYNVSGMQAVEVILTDGRMVRLGTNEPEKLVMAIERAKTVL